MTKNEVKGTEGMTPINQNITVVDEQGTIIGKTFEKRAKGLVKKGRARYLDAHTLCLVACPQNRKNSEEQMNNFNNNIVIDKETGEVLEMDFAEVDVAVNVAVDAALAEASQALDAVDVALAEANKAMEAALAEADEAMAKPAEKEPETVQVKVLRYANGMENWYGEVQILLAPQYENGRNVVPLYSTKVTYTLKIVDCYDRERIIKAKPSTVYGAGIVRGLSFVRFTPCLLKGENKWVPEQGASYWVSFEAIGTDGKRYVSSNEREIFLNVFPMSKGSAIAVQSAAQSVKSAQSAPAKKAPAAPVHMGGQSAEDVEELSEQIEELTDQVDDLEGQVDDLEGQISDLEGQISDLEAQIAEMKERGASASSGREERRIARAAGSDRKALHQVLELEQRLSAAFTESIAALAKPQSAEENTAYVQALSAVTAAFEGQLEKVRAQYGFLFTAPFGDDDEE
ncbi:MAG: FlxA-like family protein [Clostridia bacterium]|nr:FlxA-like family protein [Clostridia bacterium]